MWAVAGLFGLGTTAVTVVALHQATTKKKTTWPSGPQGPQGPGGSGGSGGSGGWGGPPGPTTIAGLDPSTFQAQGNTHYYQIPSNAKGLVIFFPGCARSARGFWPKSPSHPECAGMPEDVSHTKQALAKGYGVLALVAQTQSGQYKDCWRIGVDIKWVPSVITSFLQQHGLKGKPVYIVGASSGGGFVQYLPKLIPGIVSGVISEVEAHATIPLKNPPTIFVVMQNDPKGIADASGHVATYRARGIPADYVVSAQRTVGPTFFSDLIVNVTPQQSQAAVTSLKSTGTIDGNGKFVRNPKDTRGRWMPPLHKIMTFEDAFETNSVLQAMLFAYADHEHVANYTTAALTWFEGGCKADFKSLAASLEVDKPASFAV